jgi:hypothetical protein
MNTTNNYTKAYYCYYQPAAARVCVVKGENDPYQFIKVTSAAKANAVIAGLVQQGYVHKVNARD